MEAMKKKLYWQWKNFWSVNKKIREEIIMDKKETKVTPVKVTAPKPAAAEEEKTVKAEKKEEAAKKEVKTEVSVAEEPKKETAKKAAPAKKTTANK